MKRYVLRALRDAAKRTEQNVRRVRRRFRRLAQRDRARYARASRKRWLKERGLVDLREARKRAAAAREK